MSRRFVMANPSFGGLRYTVAIMLELLSSGMTVDEILAEYENLEESILAAFAMLGNCLFTLVEP